jgi:hypothetical protein
MAKNGDVVTVVRLTPNVTAALESSCSHREEKLSNGNNGFIVIVVIGVLRSVLSQSVAVIRVNSSLKR